MSSQFEKRKARQAADVVKDIESKRENIRAKAANEPVYTQKGYDVFTPDGGSSYFVIEIDYNPDTGHAKVSGASKISRLIALQYAGQKQALGILKKGR